MRVFAMIDTKVASTSDLI